MCCGMLGAHSGRGTFRGRREGARATHFHTISWREAEPFFATTRRTLSQIPAQPRAHLAVVAGHVSSQCAYEGKTRRNREEACWFCGRYASPDFEHVMWVSQHLPVNSQSSTKHAWFAIAIGVEQSCSDH